MNLNTKILIVDDMQTMRRVLKSALVDLGFTDIADADGGSAALAMLGKEAFELVITDWNMPDMAGIDLLRALRADDKWKNLPVLMVTAEAKKELIMEAAKAGVNGYLIKPFQPAMLKEKLEKVI